jgi:hypothetical protein
MGLDQGSDTNTGFNGLLVDEDGTQPTWRSNSTLNELVYSSHYSKSNSLATTVSTFLFNVTAQNFGLLANNNRSINGETSIPNQNNLFYGGPQAPPPPILFEEFLDPFSSGESRVSSSTLATILSEKGNDDGSDQLLPSDLRTMSESSRNCVIAYSILFLIASTGNLTVFASFYRQYKKHRSRISLLIVHLSVADLIVSFCLIPIEIFWRMTIQWYGGNALCKACQFMRAFGLYLSSMVLICVSFDRFFAILFPLRAIGGQHRVKVMLWMAWIASGVFSAPQVIIFFNFRYVIYISELVLSMAY